MFARLARFRDDERGTSALEFGLIAPLLFTFIFASVQLGWALHCGSQVRFALDTAARQLLLDPNTTQAQLRSAMTPILTGTVDPAQVAITLTQDASNPAVTMARAESVYTHQLQIAFLPVYTLQFRARTAVPIS